MKINLDELKYLYDYLKENEELDKINDDNNISFNDFKEYIIDTIIENVEYDFDITFSNYVDISRFIERK